jgi:ribosomal protein L31E
MAKDYKEKKITVNLSKVFAKPVTKRAKGAIFMLRAKVRKETRAKEVFLSNQVNETIWEKGMFSCPRKMTIKVVKDKDDARVYLPDEKIVVKKEEKKKQEKGIKAKAEEIAGKKEAKPEEKKEDKAPKEETPVEKKTEEKKEASKTKETKKE